MGKAPAINIEVKGLDAQQARTLSKEIVEKSELDHGDGEYREEAGLFKDRLILPDDCQQPDRSFADQLTITFSESFDGHTGCSNEPSLVINYTTHYTEAPDTFRPTLDTMEELRPLVETLAPDEASVELYLTAATF